MDPSVVLGILVEKVIENGQEQLLIRPADYRIRGVIPPDVVTATDLLRRAAAE